MDILSLMIKREVALKLTQGIKPSPKGVEINHLQFADDLIVFLDDSEEQITNLKNLYCF